MMGPGRMIKLGLGALLPGAVLVKGGRRDGRVALTFDDGPHPECTPRILDILERDGAIATFFVQGKIAEQYPGLIREVSMRGHQIGNHGYIHLDAKRTSRHRYVEDVKRAQEVLQNMVGKALDKIFRPPFGNVTGTTFVSLACSGYRFVFWSADSRDSFIRNPAEIIEHISTLNIVGGDILLLHEDYSHTVAALPGILQSLRSRALTFCRVGDLRTGQTPGIK